MKFSLNKRYQCPFCKKVFVVLQGYSKYSILPVEEILGSEVHDKEFKKGEHKSHLLNCKELQERWCGISEDYRKAVWEQEKRENQIMMR